MKKHSKTITVLPEHLDELQHVNNVTYVAWIQEISAEHWGNAATEEMKKKYYWVVRNHNITYHQQAFLNDEISIETYILHNKGPLSTRFVEMTRRKTGQRLVTSETQWCLLHSESMKPLRVTDDIVSLF